MLDALRNHESILLHNADRTEGATSRFDDGYVGKDNLYKQRNKYQQMDNYAELKPGDVPNLQEGKIHFNKNTLKLENQ